LPPLWVRFDITFYKSGKSTKPYSNSSAPSTIPRVAAGIGAVAVGVGIELVRRGLMARIMPAPKPPQPVSNSLPALNRLRDVLFPQNDKRFKLPKNYEIEETVVYMRRVIRRKS
jgi:hypothetical protein